MIAEALPAHEVAHATIRAKERYGIILDWHDLHNFAARCNKGEGLMETKPNGIRLHTLIFGDFVLWMVWHFPTPMQPDGLVMTIMPASSGAARSCRDYDQMISRKGEKRTASKRWGSKRT
jgi:hypothetical protein